MHIETTAGQLRAALKMVKPVIHRSALPPVFACVRIAAAGASRARLEAKDLDLRVALDLVVSSASQGACFVLDHAVLLRLVGNLHGDRTVRIEDAADGNVVLSFGTARYRLAAMGAGSWPEFEGIDLGLWRGAPWSSLVDALRFVRPCISTEETRYYLNGVCLDGREVVATDGHRLASCDSGLDLPEGLRPIVPTDAVRMLIAAGDVGCVEVGPEWIRAHVPGGVVSAKLINVGGNGYPNWRRVLPDATATVGPAVMRVDMDRAEATEVLTRLLGLRDGGRSMAVSLVLASGRVAVTGTCVDHGHGDEVLRKAGWSWVARRPANMRPLSASFNLRYLRDLLGGIKAARVSLWLRHYDDAERMGDPSVLTACGEVEPPVVPVEGIAPVRRLVLMPMRAADHGDAVVTDLAERMAGEPAGAAGAGVLGAAE